MATIDISLPDGMRDWVEAQARTGGYSNASDYVRDLIRRDQERLSGLVQLQQLVTEGIESGVSPRSEDQIRQLGRQNLAAARSA